MTDKLPYSPISDERIDDAVICYLQEYPRHRVIKWGSIEFRLTDVSKTDLELAYWRTHERYEVIEAHNYHSATIFRIPKHLKTKTVTPSTLARVVKIAKETQGGTIWDKD